MGSLKGLCLPSTNNHLNKLWIFIIIFLSLSCFIYAHIPFEIVDYLNGGLRTPICPQVDVLTPQATADLWDSLNAEINTPEFKAKAIKWLSGAVRIPTESYDDMGPVEKDPRWDVFKPFHDYLDIAFPLVSAAVGLTKINTHGLLFEWHGSDPTLKPLLLIAHQDVVPVDLATIHKWKYPPYSGHFDGERIWGRGSIDDKSGLIGILSAVETLVASGFQPTRTVVLAFGFDEEANGLEGAGCLASHLQKIYGENGIAMIVDEGAGFVNNFGSVIAIPGIAEKGYLNAIVEVTSPGGHSSVPPAHTSIGMLAALLVEFESHPIKAEITRNEPIYGTLQCVAEHAKSMPSHFRHIVKQSVTSDRALHQLQEFIRSDKTISSMVRTTQAIDVIHGGVKSNALPEQAWAIVNHRVAVVSSINEIKAHDIELLRPLAIKFNLTYKAFGNIISEENASSSGTLTLDDLRHTSIEPAPFTPTGGEDAAPYHLLSGTIKATFNAHRSCQDVDSIVVAPGMMTGNTDTRYYWRLSEHIFRYRHHNDSSAEGNSGLDTVHSVNESVEVDSYLEMIRFFITLILNADEAKSF